MRYAYEFFLPHLGSFASMRKFLDEARKIAAGQDLNYMTGKSVTIKYLPTDKMLEIVSKVIAPH